MRGQVRAVPASLLLPCCLPMSLTPLLLSWQGVKGVPFLRDHLVIHLMNIY